jgi:hypothetical protein
LGDKDDYHPILQLTGPDSTNDFSPFYVFVVLGFELRAYT